MTPSRSVQSRGGVVLRIRLPRPLLALTLALGFLASSISAAIGVPTAAAQGCTIGSDTCTTLFTTLNTHIGQLSPGDPYRSLLLQRSSLAQQAAPTDPFRARTLLVSINTQVQ